MFIIFEGCDGTGKSGLAGSVTAEIMVRDRDCSVHEIHRSQLKRPPLDEYVHDVSRYKPGTQNHVVADRWHWGEEVYGPIYRDKSASTLAQFRWIELWLASRGVCTWHVTQPIDRLVKRLTDRGEDYLKPEHVELVQSMFADVAASSITRTGDVSPEGDNRELANRIVNRAEYTEQSVLALQDYPSYVGPALPHTILVGDKRGGPGPYVTKSAFMPINGNSADLLLSSLPDDWWRGVGLVNASETGDALVPLLDALCGPTVVALGRAASDVLLDFDIEHAGVPHPRYVREYHSSKKMQYGMLIRENARTGEMSFSWPS